MKLTREQIDFLCPEHSRTSCDDRHLINSYFSSEERRLPKCNRCFLLKCLELNWEEPAITIIPSVELRFKPQPCTKCGGKGVC